MTSTAIEKAPEAIAHAESGGTIAAFGSVSNFESAQRMAKALSSSSLVPAAYQNNVPNCLIAMELAGRIGVSVFATMQNLDVIHGNPSWRSKFLLATVNGSGRFSPIRYKFQGEEGKDSWGCRAVARDRETGDECVGPLITIKIAKDEGWYTKNGSKWKTIPELMLCYRAAAFWTRLYAPELSLGMQTSEEAQDIGATVLPSAVSSPASLEAKLMSETPIVAEPAHDPETGVVEETSVPMREPGEEG